MNQNPLLFRLGFSAGDRVVVLHADDIGLCQSTVTAYERMAAHGILSSASAMVPSGWFPTLANLCRDESHEHDMGVHLTLNSEWDNYRLSPLTGSAADSLIDGFGYFHRSAKETMRFLNANQAYAELSAQIRRAHAHGLDVTHIDSHMLTLVSPVLANIYLKLSREFLLPNCIIRMSAPEIKKLCNISMEQAELVHEDLMAPEHEGLVVFDAWADLPLNQPANRLDCAKRLLDDLPEGLSHFICHPAMDTPELRAIASDWEARVADYQLYIDEKWRRAIEASGVKVIGMREIRRALFAEKMFVPDWTEMECV